MINKFLSPYFWLHILDIILKKPQARNGFIEYTPSGLDEIHYAGKDEVLGNAKTVLCPDGQWDKYRPEGELQQRNSSETLSCVSHSACNAIEEIILRLNAKFEAGEAIEEEKGILAVFKHFNILRQENDINSSARYIWRANSSDRYIAKLSNTTYRGNTQKNVADAIRHYGLVPDQDWPWVDGWNNYYTPVSETVIAKGKALADYIEFNYEWAVSSIYKDSLKYAPLQTSVFAWNGTQNKVYYRIANQRNHAIVRDGYTDKTIKVYDSYEPFGKETTKDFSFGNDLIFTLHLKKPLTKFNLAEIQKVRKEKGWEFVVLVKDYNEQYTQGVYQLTDNGLVKLTSADTVDDFVLAKKKDGKLEGVPPEWFARLIT